MNIYSTAKLYKQKLKKIAHIDDYDDYDDYSESAEEYAEREERNEKLIPYEWKQNWLKELEKFDPDYQKRKQQEYEDKRYFEFLEKEKKKRERLLTPEGIKEQNELLERAKRQWAREKAEKIISKEEELDYYGDF